MRVDIKKIFGESYKGRVWCSLLISSQKTVLKGQIEGFNIYLTLLEYTADQHLILAWKSKVLEVGFSRFFVEEWSSNCSWIEISMETQYLLGWWGDRRMEEREWVDESFRWNRCGQMSERAIIWDHLRSWLRKLSKVRTERNWQHRIPRAEGLGHDQPK